MKTSDQKDDSWEYIGKDTFRLRVYGGWLVRTEISTLNSDGGVAVSLIFIVDATHIWEL